MDNFEDMVCWEGSKIGDKGEFFKYQISMSQDKTL